MLPRPARLAARSWLPFALALTLAVPVAARATPRLGRLVIPTSESVSLTLDPGRPDYRGTVEIALQVPAPVDSFRFHALGLTLDSLVLRRGATRVAATWRPGADGLVVVRTRHPLTPGDHTLAIGFHARFDTQALALYRVKQGADWYAFTQFEAVEARRAFPCWDEPDFKIPWRFTLRAPRGLWAAANTPVARTRDDGAWRVTTFEPSPPMPSYLVAFAVGPFDTLSVAGLPGPGRILSPRGTRADAVEAAAQAGPLLAALERWFGLRHPYAKLDLVAAPEFAYGAMENPGLIVFLDHILIQDRRTMSPSARAHMATDIAHEMAHLWFGDFVTMRWWDDLWLNESFASWMGDRTCDEVFPGMKFGTRQLEGRARAFTTDAQPGVRAMRRPIGETVDLDQLADALAYEKGQALLRMFEQWLGPGTFRDGVREYLRRTAWGNAVGPELWATLSEVSGRDVSGPMASFLDQAGVPEVTVEQAGGGRITLSQHRFLERAGADTMATLWRIPVVLALGDGKTVHRQRVLLERARQTFALDVADPLWVHPNADESGYYRWHVPPAMFERIVAAGSDALTERERIALPDAAFAALAAGEIDGGEVVRVIERAARDPEPLVVAAALTATERLRAAFVDDPTDPVYAGWLARTYAPALARIGLTPRPGEPEAASDLRPQLVWQLGAYARDTSLTARAAREAERWLADPASVEPSLAETWLWLAARDGDAARFDAYRRRFESGLPSDLRRVLIGSFGRFRDPVAMQRALDYALAGPLRPQEVLDVVDGWSETPALRARARAWVRERYGEIEARIPRSYLDALPHVGQGCGDEGLAETKAFFGDPARVSPGYREELIQLEDRQTGCGQMRARAGDSVRRAFGAAPAP